MYRVQMYFMQNYCLNKDTAYTTAFTIFPVCFICRNRIMHITEERSDPRGAAIPIGKSVAGKSTEASHAPGILIRRIEARFDTNEYRLNGNIPLNINSKRTLSELRIENGSIISVTPPKNDMIIEFEISPATKLKVEANENMTLENLIDSFT